MRDTADPSTARTVQSSPTKGIDVGDNLSCEQRSPVRVGVHVAERVNLAVVVRVHVPPLAIIVPADAFPVVVWDAR